MVVHFSVNKVIFFLVLKMSTFVPNKVYLRGILLHYFIQKKSAAEAHRILVETYGDNALSDTTCRDWFRRFKNNIFELEDKERSGAPKKFKDETLEELLDQDRCQTLAELGKTLQVDESTVSKRLKVLGMIQKQGHWELKPRDAEQNNKQEELTQEHKEKKIKDEPQEEDSPTAIKVEYLPEESSQMLFEESSSEHKKKKKKIKQVAAEAAEPPAEKAVETPISEKKKKKKKKSVSND